MARSYRCPVCGIDFPAGTPGAPKAPEPAGGSEPDAGVAPTVDDTLRADLNIAPGGAANGDGVGRREPRMSAGATGSETEAEIAAEGEPPRPSPPSGSLSVRPARPAASAVAVPPQASTTVARPRRRSRARALGGTMVSALVLIGAVLAGAYLYGDRLAGPLLDRVRSDALSVTASDGWVSLPSDDKELVVTADGPFRLRVDGEVYTLTGAQAVRIPPQSAASLRIIRAPTSATVQELTGR